MKKNAGDFWVAQARPLSSASRCAATSSSLSSTTRSACRPCGGFFPLDEPEAALSPQRQLAALARILQFSAEGIVETRYEATEHFRVMRDFLADPAAALQKLFSQQRR